MPNAPIPAYTAVIYDVADVLDEIAATPKGRAQAEAIASKAANIVIQAFPQVATRKLGALLVAKYKAAATADESEAAFKARHGLTDADMTMLRYKAAPTPGMVAIELPADLVERLGGRDAIVQRLTQQELARLPAHGAKLADDEKAATAIKSIAQQTMPNLYKK
jgi:hypothetical protein